MAPRTFGAGKPVLDEANSAFYPGAKIGLFIDAANVYRMCQKLNVDIDWRKFRQYWRDQGHLIRIFYYTGVMPRDGSTDHIRPQLDWLDYNGYHMRVKQAKTFIDPVTKRELVKGNMDIELAIDMLDATSILTDVVLFSGDGDFTPLVARVQREGICVHVVSTIIDEHKMCADDLRRQADIFHEFATLARRFIK